MVRFKQERTSVYGEERSERMSASTTENNVRAIKDVAMENRWMTVEETQML